MSPPSSALAARAAQTSAWLETPRGRYVAKWARRTFTVALVGFLAWNLSRQGITVRDVWASLPSTPLFYVLWLTLYTLLPSAETAIYARIWRLPTRELLPVLLRKRVLSQDVLGYSGEVFLYGWARRRLGPSPPDGEGPPVALHIKDNILLSSFASVLSAAIIIGTVLVSGAHNIDHAFPNPRPIYAVLGTVAVVFVVTMATRARRAVFTLAPRDLAFLATAHGLRFTLANVFLLLIWSVSVPGLPLDVWATLLVVNVVIDRVPFVPASDLVFVNTALALAAPMGVPPEAITGVLVGKAALDKLLNLTLFTAAPLLRRRRSDLGGAEGPTPPEGAPDASQDTPSNPSLEASHSNGAHAKNGSVR